MACSRAGLADPGTSAAAMLSSIVGGPDASMTQVSIGQNPTATTADQSEVSRGAPGECYGRRIRPPTSRPPALTEASHNADGKIDAGIRTSSGAGAWRHVLRP